MRLSELCSILFGEISWTPPAWLRRIGARRAGWGFLALLGVTGLVAAGYLYYQSLPKPLQVAMAVEPPGITAIAGGELAPDPIRLDFSYLPNPDVLMPESLSAARLDLIGKTLDARVELRPEMPGKWRFETENRLIFEPAEDWPPKRTYRLRLAPEIFAPGIELADAEAEFATPPFGASITAAEFYQHPVKASERRVVASLKFSHPVSRFDLVERLRMSILDGGERRRLNHHVEYGPQDRTANVHSEIISIGEQENIVTVTLAAGLVPAGGDDPFGTPLSVQVRIPDRASYFRVRDIKTSIVNDDDDNPVQTAVVRFTDQVNTNDFTDSVKACLLPKARTVGTETHQRYRWRSSREVTPEVMAECEPLNLVVNPTERDTAEMQSVTFDAPEGQYIYFNIGDGLTSKGGFVMASTHAEVARAPDYPKEATIALEGALLPLSRNRRLTLSSRGVTAIKVEIQQLQPGAFNHLASQTGGDIRDPSFRSRIFNADNISSLTTRIVDVNPGHPRERIFATVDLNPLLDEGGLFIVRVQGWNRRQQSTVGWPDRRMALVTDLGLLVKTNIDQSQHVFVHSVATGKPVAGARVELLGKNGVAVLSATTDARGQARLESASDFVRGQEPSVFVVRYGRDVTFMPYQRRDRRLTWSGFDTGGEREAVDDRDKLKAGLYTDRGLYRPGETVRLLGIVRRGDFGLVSGAPIELRVDDARGRRALRTRAALPDDGLLTWRFDTRLESPTGQYRANVYLIDDDGNRQVLGGTSFSVEDYQPDRLRIRVAVEGSPEGGWVQPGPQFARVSLENLFGTPAQKRRVRGTLVLRPVSPKFAEHPGFVFTDPFRDPQALPRSVRLKLDEVVTGGDGIARLPFDLGKYDNGIYRLQLMAEGFEQGAGRSVKAVAGTLMSPAEALIGYKTDGDLKFIVRNAKRTVRFLAVDRNAEPTSLDGLVAVLYERRYVSVLVRQPNGTYAYQSVLKENEVERETFALPAAGRDLPLPSGRPGRYALELVSGAGVKLSRIEFAVAGAANLAGNLERDAELDLKLDRREYRAGDQIAMEITAPYAGTGLITIERERVHAFKWFHSDTNTVLQSIRLPDDLEGNAYVNVAFVRDIDSQEIFVSPLSYAVAPFLIDRSARRLDIDLTAPARVRPGDELALGYATTVPSRLVLFAVDEGILQVAKYKTPDPLGTFLRKKALQVDTHQMVDLILPDYDVIRRAAAPGGGEGARLLGANLNPFRRRSEPPVVFWTDVLEAGPERRDVRFKIPDYFNGELRVMAVGVSTGKLGGSETPVTVRGPIVLTPSFPLAAAPNDRFDVSVGIANNVESSGPAAELALTAAPSERISVEGDASRALVVAEGGEGRATFRVRAGTTPGAAELTLTARRGEIVVRRAAGFSVRPAVAFETTLSSGFSADGTAQLALPRRLHKAFARQRVAASASPLVLADGLLEYLDTFPHACAEQIVSKIFPQLGLLQSPSFPLDRAAFGELFTRTMLLLGSRQHRSGGFHFWITSDEAAPFPSVYVAHFMTDAQALGLAVPSDMLDAALGYLRRIAGAVDDRRSGTDLRDARTRAYAIYILTRNGAVTTNYLSALQEALAHNHGDAWRGDIVSAYMAASHALLRNDTLAESLIAGYRLGESTQPDTDFHTRLGRDAQYIYLVARHFPDRMAQLDGDAVRGLVEPIFENRFNTLSAAYTILALGEIHRSLARRNNLTPPEIVARSPDGPVDVEATGSVFARASLPVAVDSVVVTGKTDGGVYFTVSQSGFDVELPASPLAQGIEIERVYLDGEDKRVNRADVGDELSVRLRVRSQSGRISNVAVTDLLPGGFEIVTDSVRTRYGTTVLDYRDVREDRLVLYGGFGNNVTEIRYRVTATTPGDFAAPAAHAAAMYHRSIRARTASGRLIVDGP